MDFPYFNINTLFDWALCISYLKIKTYLTFLYSEQYFYISILMIFNSLQTLDITIVINHQNVSILCLLSE